MINIFDIGAFGGAFDEWKRIRKYINYYGFEPNENECNKLNNQKKKQFNSEQYFPYAIAGKSEKKKFYNTMSPRCSSLLEPNNSEFKKYGEIGTLRQLRGTVQSVSKISTLSLVDFCKEVKRYPDFINIDTQGSELDILIGSKILLNSLIGLEIEVEFVPLYKNQPLFSEVEIFLRKNGFEIFGLKRNLWKMNNSKYVTKEQGGRLTYGDALFFNAKLFEKKRISKDIAINAWLLLKRFDLNDVADLIISIHDLNITDLPKIEHVEKQALSHKGKGDLIDFDDRYGF